MIELCVIYECAKCGARNKFEPDEECLSFDLSGDRGDYNYIYDNCEKCETQNEIVLYGIDKIRS